MEIKKIKEREGKNNPPQPTSYKDILLYALIILGVVAFGLVAFNQYMELRFKATFLTTPCELCRELNPRLDVCFEDALSVIIDTATGEEIEFKDIKKIEYPNISEIFINLTN